VGLIWSSNPQNRQARKRDIPLESLLPLLTAEGIDFFSLQMGDASAQIGLTPGASGIIEHKNQITDFSDTAAFMSELDLIISVDTAAAHLAGALGRPVWTLLAFAPDWRWGLEGESTPWYPTMRLFRQPALGDWESVISRVAAELERLASSRIRSRG
jgi:hypothetical protein